MTRFVCLIQGERMKQLQNVRHLNPLTIYRSQQSCEPHL